MKTDIYCISVAGADKKAEAGAGAATEFQFVSTTALTITSVWQLFIDWN